MSNNYAGALQYMLIAVTFKIFANSSYKMSSGLVIYGKNRRTGLSKHSPWFRPIVLPDDGPPFCLFHPRQLLHRLSGSLIHEQSESSSNRSLSSKENLSPSLSQSNMKSIMYKCQLNRGNQILRVVFPPILAYSTLVCFPSRWQVEASPETWGKPKYECTIWPFLCN